MSTLETNSIGKYSGNNVSVDDALNLKSYTTTQRDALTSVAGDTIYNTTDSKVQVYTGSAWEDLGGSSITVDYVVVGAGGGGALDFYTSDSNGRGGSGGSGAALLTSYSTDVNSGSTSTTEPDFIAFPGQSYNVSIGAGGIAGTTTSNLQGGATGNNTRFANVVAIGGSGGAAQGGGDMVQNKTYGGGGAGGVGRAHNGDTVRWSYNANFGYAGGSGSTSTGFPTGGSGGGGGAGSNASGTTGGTGGIGRITTIISDSQATSASVGEVDSSNVYFCGGGAGKGQTGGTGGTGGGGNAANARAGNGTNGAANTGGGGGAGSQSSSSSVGGTGGSGCVILRYPNTYTATTSGLTTSTASSGSDSILIITAGTGTVSWS